MQQFQTVFELINLPQKMLLIGSGQITIKLIINYLIFKNITFHPIGSTTPRGGNIHES